MKSIRCWDDLSAYGIVPLTLETQYLLCHTAMRVAVGARRAIPFEPWSMVIGFLLARDPVNCAAMAGHRTP